MSVLSYVPENAHDVRVGERRVLFHVPTTAMFDLDEVGGAVLDLFKDKTTVSERDVRDRLQGRYRSETLRKGTICREISCMIQY